MTLPGLSAVVERPPADPEPLGTDVAVFAGRTLRGPVGQAVAAVGLREYEARFGGLAKGAVTPYAVRSYFENGGEVAWIVRLEGPAATAATATWEIGPVTDEGVWGPEAPSRAGFTNASYEVEATSPGAWANGAELRIELRVLGAVGEPEVDVRVTVPGAKPEYHIGIAPAAVAEAVTGRSRYVRLLADDTQIPPMAGPTPGPQAAVWTIRLDGGADDRPAVADYLTGARIVADLDEPALVAVPDLATDLTTAGDRMAVVRQLAVDATASLDRLLLLDVPIDHLQPMLASTWLDGVRRDLGEPALRRACAAYHPPIRVDDPLGGRQNPLRTVPPSGAVAGVISRLDRERGPHHTPANATLYQTVDVEEAFDAAGQAQLYRAGLNNLRCTPGRGIEVWGGRTVEPDPDPLGTFVAHRRLVHRIVRAARRVAEPLVFDVNGPELWFTIVRALTTILLEAHRSGALKGRTPDEAFLIQCDEEVNPPSQRDEGVVVCLVSIAPAAPMEFIVLRLSFGVQGALEVVEQ